MPIYFSTLRSTSWELGKQSVLIRTKRIRWLITVAGRSHQSQMFCGGCADVFKTQFSPKTLSQTAKRPTTPAQGFQRTGYWACDSLCVHAHHRYQNSRIWCRDCHGSLKWGGSCVPQFSLMCLSSNHNDACAHTKIFHTHLVSPAVQVLIHSLIHHRFPGILSCKYTQRGENAPHPLSYLQINITSGSPKICR